MDPRDKERLQRNYAKLLDVSYSSISPHLISNFILSLEMHDEIECKPTERKKMEKLLSILPTRGNNAMKELIRALRPSYRWIAQALECVENDVRAATSSLNNNNSINNNLTNLQEICIVSHVREITRILQKSPRASTHWTFLAYSMNLLPTTIMDIKREMPLSGGYEYAIFSVLESWAVKVGSHATFSKLVAILNREGMCQCGEDVAEYWASLSARDYPEDIRASRHRPMERSRSPEVTDV